MKQFQHPDALVSTQWLAENLAAPDLRIFDCTMYLLADDDNAPYRVQSGREDYGRAHIPGAAYLDLQQDLSDNEAALRFTLPGLNDLVERFSRAGVGQDDRVVLYSRSSMQWATRVWWMLHAIGFDRAAVLDGGWEKWASERRAQSNQSRSYQAASLKLLARPEMFVGRDGVQEAMTDPQSCVINALSPALHSGQSARYGRPGRIPGSINVPASSLCDARSLTLVAPDQAAEHFALAGLQADQQAVIYCGGGIAATLDAFVLYQLGHKNITVYDNSLNEWAKDPDLPMESD